MPEVAETSAASLESIPKDLRHLRACLLCGLIKLSFRCFQSVDQFDLDGCDNCESYLQMKNDRDRVLECTSANFDGMIAMMSPDDSWVAKWQRIHAEFIKGVYATSVTGQLPAGVVRDLRSQGIHYRSRDVAQKNS